MLQMDIDTGLSERPRAKSDWCDSTMRIRFTDWTRADRARRQVIEAIESCETVRDARAYVEAETLLIDAISLYSPEMCASIREATEDHVARIDPANREPRPAEPGKSTGAPVTAQSKETENMFAIDTGDTGGSLGPWLSWSSNGSAAKGFKPMTWVLRGKDEHGAKFEQPVPAFEQGCVLDLDSLKLGWEKDGGQGMAPERRWNPSISQSTPRPDESKKPSGQYVWSRALSVRCAIGGGQAATWEQGSFAAYAAFEHLARQIEQQWAEQSQNGVLLPLVKQTAVEPRKLPSGSANIPTLQVVKWVPRPDCLKADAPTIATSAAPEPAATAAPAAQPATAAQQPEDADLEF